METTLLPAPPAPHHDSAQHVVAHLQRSELYRNYQGAFESATGLPLALRAAGSFQSPLNGSKQANAFCVLMAKSNKTCSACLQMQQRTEEEATFGARTLQCFAGLSETSIPVRTADRVLGYLQTGQVFLKAPTPTQFRRVTQHLAKLGATIDRGQLKTAFFQTRVLVRQQYESAVKLLSIFAEHLSDLSNQVMVQEAAAEDPLISRARVYIGEHMGEQLSVRMAAAAVHLSPFYFCKKFKQSTGLTFTDYLARMRVENVKQLMLNPHTRVSEAAYAAGFQSLSQFNRVFRRIIGESPSDFRARIAGGRSIAAPARPIAHAA